MYFVAKACRIGNTEFKFVHIYYIHVRACIIPLCVTANRLTFASQKNTKKIV